MTKILDVSPTADNTTIDPARGYQQSVIGRMLALACSEDGQVVYSGSFANLWVSQDGGLTWDQVAWPQPPPDQFGVPGSLGGWEVMDVAVSPTDSRTVLAMTAHNRLDRPHPDRGIWRTTDGGSNWFQVHRFPAGDAVGQLAWAPENDQLVFAAGGSALAVSRDGGATFHNVLPAINHVAVAPSLPSVPTPPAVYALGNGTMFVSFDGGAHWTQDPRCPSGVGGPVGDGNSQAPSVLVVSPRSPLEVFLVGNANQDPALWRGDYSQFTNANPNSNWQRLTLPALGGQDSGNVFLAVTQMGRGNLLFLGAQRSNVHAGPLDLASAADWVELDPQDHVHVDLHGIFLSPDFDATIQDGRLNVSAGTIWLLSDGGIYLSVLGGDFQPAKYVRTLSCVNVAGVAMEGLGPALSLNTGDNDGFYSLDGGATWASQDYGGGDNSCSYADPMTPNLMLVFTPRWDGSVTLYKSEEGTLPDATNSAQRHTVPGPPRVTPVETSLDPILRQPITPQAWNADSMFSLRASRPIVLTKGGEEPVGDGDYVFIRFKTDGKSVVLRTKSLLDIESPDDWDTLSEVSTFSAQMQIGHNTTASPPVITPDGWVYFQGTDNRLLKVFNDGSGLLWIGGNTTDSAPFVTADGWVYFRGHGDNRLLKVFNDGSGGMWIGNNKTASTPFVAPDGWVYFQGTDNRLLKVFNDGTGGTQIATNSTDSPPFVTADGWVYFRGHGDNKLWKVFNDGTGLMQVGNNFTASTPFVTSDGWVFFQGTDNRLLKVFNDGTGGMQIGTNTTDSPPFVTDDGWVYFRGHGDNKLWKVFNDGSHLVSLGGNTTASTPFVTPGGWVYFQGTDNKLWKLFIPFEQRRVFQQGPALPSSNLNVLQASGGHTGTVFYAGSLAQRELWKWTDGMTGWEKLVPGRGVTTARRFFVDPYRPNLIYVLDQTHVRRSEDGGKSWQVDASLEQQVTCGGLIPINREEIDFIDVVLQDMQFDPHRSLTRFAVGIGGAFFTNDGVNWHRLLDTAAMPGRPSNCHYDWVSDPCERSLYVALSGRGLVKIAPLPCGGLQAPDPALWSPSQALPGLQSKSTPALALFQGAMHMVRNVGPNNALVWSTSPDGINWSPDQSVGPQSQSGASLAAFGTSLHMVYLEDGSNAVRWWTFNGTVWTDQGHVPDLSVQPPANLTSLSLPGLAVFGKLILLGSDPSTSQVYVVRFDGTAWDTRLAVRGQFSTRPVKAAVFQGKIHMAYLGDSADHVCWSVFDGILWWSRTRIRCRKSQSAPALAVHNGLLHMVHQGEGSNSMCWSLYDGDEWTPAVTILGQNSRTAAGLCETPDQSHLAMLRLADSSDDIWFSAV